MATLPVQQYRNVDGELVLAHQTYLTRFDIPTETPGIMQKANPNDFIVIHSDGRHEIYPPELFHALHQKV